MKSKKNSSIHDSSKLSSISSFPKQLSFLNYYQEQQRQKQYLDKQQTIQTNPRLDSANSKQSFAHEQRQQLKNAFRYICRLCFKESKHYHSHIQKMYRKHFGEEKTGVTIKDTIETMVNDAETISGERYFKHYLQNLDQVKQVILLEYMIWFLKSKYLRYIKNTQSEKGKRKAMKRQLYLRFKNQVMLPYLTNLLDAATL